MTSIAELNSAIINVGGIVPCHNAPDLFFYNMHDDNPNEKTAARHRGQLDATIAMCDECPVKELCADYAITNREVFGIWGGLTPAARFKIIRSRKK